MDEPSVGLSAAQSLSGENHLRHHQQRNQPAGITVRLLVRQSARWRWEISDRARVETGKHAPVGRRAELLNDAASKSHICGDRRTATKSRVSIPISPVAIHPTMQPAGRAAAAHQKARQDFGNRHPCKPALLHTESRGQRHQFFFAAANTENAPRVQHLRRASSHQRATI